VLSFSAGAKASPQDLWDFVRFRVVQYLRTLPSAAVCRHPNAANVTERPESALVEAASESSQRLNEEIQSVYSVSQQGYAPKWKLLYSSSLAR